MRSALRDPQIEPYAEEFEERRSAPQRGVWGSERRALWRFPPGLARQDNPQIRVLPTQIRSETRKFSSPTALLITSRSDMKLN